jgi:CCR4-NOT transcription complex subunit 3
MATLRKLQVEIEKTLKRIAEGIAVFDDFWEQLYAAEAANQKEKLEGQLKTEIKKLQRFRDQVKTWMALSELKDKSALADARRDIEKRMEKFKVCEKEAKTKAFSKEGLAAAAAKVDPKERAKAEAREWASGAVDALTDEVERFEAEAEEIGPPKGRRAKPPPRLAHLEESAARHRAHVVRLEQLMRLLDRDEVAPEEVEGVRDAVDDYLERGQEAPADFVSVDEAYADVLGALESLGDAVVAAPPSHAKATARDRAEAKEREREERERERQKAAAAAAKAQLAAQGNARLAEEDRRPPATPTAPPAGAAAGGKERGSEKAAAAAPSGRAAAQPASPGAGGGRGGESGPGTPVRAGSAAAAAAAAPAASPATPAAAGLGPPPPAPPPEAFAPLGGAANGAVAGGRDGAQAPPLPVGAAMPLRQAPRPDPAALALRAGSLDPGANEDGAEQLAAQLRAMGLDDPAAGTPAPLAPALAAQVAGLAAPRSAPQPGDAAWPALRPRPPAAGAAAPPSYPRERLPIFDYPALYEKLDPETLFFAFYQLPGTHQQHLAARSLKAQAWRFHRQHLAWFQRHEEPKAGGQPGDEWEQGTYVYFDNLLHADAAGGEPSGWCYRLKGDFLFSYAALEDEVTA